MPFLKTNQITIPFHEDYIKVQNKFKLPVTPNIFVENNSEKQKNSYIVNIKQSSVVMPGDYIEENLPTNFKPNSPYIVSPFDGKLQSQLLPIEYDAAGQKNRITNTSEKPENLEKKSQAFQVCPLHTDPRKSQGIHTSHEHISISDLSL